MSKNMISIHRGLGRIDEPDTDTSKCYPPIKMLTDRQRSRRKQIVFEGLSFYIYDSLLPGIFDRSTLLASRGGMADLIHRFEVDHARDYRIDRVQADVLDWPKTREEQFARGDEYDIYEGLNHRLAHHFIDLRPYLKQKNPFTGRQWHTGFRPEAKRLMGFSARGRPVPFLLIDFTAPAINYNRDILEGLDIGLPVTTWKEWEAALERCDRADFVWPIALFNAPPQCGILNLVCTVQDMLLRTVEKKIAGPDDEITNGHLLAALKRRTLSERTPAYVESLSIIKRLAKYFIWYANRYDSIHVKPFYFSRRPQSLFRFGDFRRVRADMELYECVEAGRRRFPFREGAMSIPEITRATSKYAGGPPRATLRPSAWLGVTKAARQRKTLSTVIRFLQFLTTPENQRFFTSFSHTISTTKGVPIPRPLRRANLTLEPLRIYYDGICPAARKRWFAGIQAMIEPNGSVEQMQKAVREAIRIDLEGTKGTE
jgi:hypothetical protein